MTFDRTPPPTPSLTTSTITSTTTPVAQFDMAVGGITNPKNSDQNKQITTETWSLSKPKPTPLNVEQLEEQLKRVMEEQNRERDFYYEEMAIKEKEYQENLAKMQSEFECLKTNIIL